MERMLDDAKKPQQAKKDVIKFFNDRVFRLNFYRYIFVSYAGPLLSLISIESICHISLP